MSAVAPGPSNIQFKKSKFLAGGEVTFEAASPDREVMAAMVTNQPFPNRQIDIGNIGIHANANQAISFDGGKGKVNFSAQAGGFEALGVYPEPDKLLDALKRNQLEDSIVSGMNLVQDAAHNYVLLRWGYDLKGAVKGAVALGFGVNATFGVNAQRDGLYGVVRCLPKSTGAMSAVGDTLESWMLPSQIQSVDDLKPGTWVIAEVDGALGLKLGAQFGYDFNWVREAVELGGLTGDIGLRVQLGVSATLGFNASGEYTMVVSRESLNEADRVLRVQVFKLSKKGWDFAFDASATAQANFDTLLPDHFDDFIAGVFNVHGLQVLKDLDKWTDPNNQLADLFGTELVNEAKDLLHQVTGIDPEQAFDQARDRLQGLIKKWQALPHQTASALYSIIRDERVNLAPFRDILRKIANSTPETLAGELTSVLNRVDFFQTPIGKWLESAATDGIMTSLSSTPEITKLQEKAKLTLSILDGSLVETTLKNLQDYIDRHLGLNQIEHIVNDTDFNKIDQWLKARLSSFLGHELNFAELDKIRTAIHTLLAKREQFYQKAKEALTRKYQFEFLGKYQKTTTRTGLLNVEFDFNANGVNPVSLTDLFRKAIDGDFDTLLVQKPAGVTLHQGTLTHEVKRQSHIEITLPFFNTAMDHINQSLAQANAVDSEDGRLLVFDLDATDIVTRKNKCDSRLAVGAHFGIGSNVRVHNQDALTYSYAFRQAIQNMKRSHLQYQLKSYVNTYFPNTFRGPDKQPYDTWLSDVDTAIENKLHNGQDNFGNTLLSLEVSLPGQVMAYWKQAPREDLAPAYLNMSRHLQRKLKELIPFCHFQDPSKYKDLESAFALLVYAAIPPSTSVHLDNGRLTLNENPARDIYWNWVDEAPGGVRSAMVNNSITAGNLGAQLTRVHDLLSTIPELQGTAQFYQLSELDKIRQGALTHPMGKALLHSLLFVEAEVVKGAYDAGRKLAKFLEQVNDRPFDTIKSSEAVAALTDFGSKLTNTFNKRIDSVYQGDALRPLGTMVFLEAAQALNPQQADGSSASHAGFNAMLDLIVLTAQPQFQLGDFLKHQTPDAKDIVIEERLVNLGASV